jgi:hypothetical protein
MFSMPFSTDTLETIKLISAIVGGLLGVLATAGTVIWRISRNAAKFQARFEGLEAGFLQLSNNISENEKKTQQYFRTVHAGSQEISKSFMVLSTKLEEREKDSLRMEGAIDETRKNILELTGGIRESKASLDALWLTLQKLFPDKVPARLSDR